jgi:elastin
MRTCSATSMRGAGSGVGASFTAAGAGLLAVTTSASFGLAGTGGVGTGVSTIGAGGSTAGLETFSVVRGAAVCAGIGLAGTVMVARTGTGTGAGAMAALPGTGTDGIGTDGLSAGTGLAVIAGGSAAAASS